MSEQKLITSITAYTTPSQDIQPVDPNDKKSANVNKGDLYGLVLAESMEKLFAVDKDINTQLAQMSGTLSLERAVGSILQSGGNLQSKLSYVENLLKSMGSSNPGIMNLLQGAKATLEKYADYGGWQDKANSAYAQWEYDNQIMYEFRGNDQYIAWYKEIYTDPDWNDFKKYQGYADNYAQYGTQIASNSGKGYCSSASEGISLATNIIQNTLSEENSANQVLRGNA